jgi:hypothetical protein
MDELMLIDVGASGGIDGFWGEWDSIRSLRKSTA